MKEVEKSENLKRSNRTKLGNKPNHSNPYMPTGSTHNREHVSSHNKEEIGDDMNIMGSNGQLTTNEAKPPDIPVNNVHANWECYDLKVEDNLEPKEIGEAMRDVIVINLESKEIREAMGDVIVIN